MKRLKRHDSPAISQRPRGDSRRGTGGLAGLATVVVLIAATSGGVWWWTRHRGNDAETGILLHTVARDDFELNVTERGEIEAFDVTEVRSLVKSNNTTGYAILRIVPEGTVVPVDVLGP